MSSETHTLDTVFGRAVLYDIDEPLRPHVHSALHALLPVPGTGSGGVTTFGDDEHELKGREAVFVDPWVTHGFKPLDGEPAHVVAIYVEPAMVRRADAETLAVSFKDRQRTLSDDELERTGALANMLRTVETRRNVEDVRRAFDALVTVLLHNHAVPHAVGGLPDTGAMDRHLRAAIRWLHEHKAQAFSTDALLASSELARSQLFERFREAIGVTPKRYADALRIECAVALLASHDTTVADAASQLGFATQAHFSRFVREMTGMTPSDHRRAANARGEAPIFLNEFK